MKNWKMASLLLASLLVGCASQVSMPPMADHDSEADSIKRVLWHDLITDVPEQSRQFYSELFGWKFEELAIQAGANTIGYQLVRNRQGRLIAGLVDQNQLASEHNLAQWVTVFGVADAHRSKSRIEALGGQVFGGPTSVLNRGLLTVAADSQGALFATLEAKGPVPSIIESPILGDFLWDELWTLDVDKAHLEYQELLELQSLAVTGAAPDYRVLADGDQARVGVMTNPIVELPSVWVNYLKVDSAEQLDEIVARVDKLGGQVLAQPQDRPGIGRVAFIAGPSGAGIALQSWARGSVASAAAESIKGQGE